MASNVLRDAQDHFSHGIVRVQDHLSLFFLHFIDDRHCGKYLTTPKYLKVYTSSVCQVWLDCDCGFCWFLFHLLHCEEKTIIRRGSQFSKRWWRNYPIRTRYTCREGLSLLLGIPSHSLVALYIAVDDDVGHADISHDIVEVLVDPLDVDLHKKAVVFRSWLDPLNAITVDPNFQAVSV